MVVVVLVNLTGGGVGAGEHDSICCLWRVRGESRHLGANSPVLVRRAEGFADIGVKRARFEHFMRIKGGGYDLKARAARSKRQ